MYGISPVRRSLRSSSASSSSATRPLVAVRAERRDLVAQLLQFLGLRPLQRDAARQAVAHRAQQREVGRRAGDRIAGAMPAHALGVHHPALREIGQFQVFQEQIDELVARQGEAEIVLPVAVRAAFRAAAARAALRARDRVALDVLLVAGQQVVAHAAAGAAVERRFVHALRGQRDLARLVGVLDAAAGRAFVHRLADQRLGTPHEPLPVGEVLAAGVETAVDDVHEVACSGGALFTPPA